MNQSGVAPGFAGFAATPGGEAQYMAYAENPFKFLNQPQNVLATVGAQNLGEGGDVSGNQTLFQQWAQQGILPSNYQQPAAASTAPAAPAAPGINAQPTTAGSGNTGQGLAGNVPSSSGMAGLGGMPNSHTVADALGTTPGMVQAGMMGLGMVAAPVGMALSGMNAIGNVANTVNNSNMLGNMGVNVTTGQELGGMLGQNGLAGSDTGAMGFAMGTPNGRQALSIGQAQGDLGPGASMPTDGTAPVGQVTSQSLSGNQPGMGGIAGNSGGISGQGDGVGGSVGTSNGGGGDYAIGGVIKEAGNGFFAKKLAKGSGLVHGLSNGRADKISTRVPKGGYVVPADVVSGIGQGNTLAGSKSLTSTFKAMKMPALANGGRVQGVDVHLSAGEYYVHPHHVAALGDGDMNAGSAKLDALVKQVRGAVVQHAMTAPPPA